jgi:hypothetical protein
MHFVLCTTYLGRNEGEKARNYKSVKRVTTVVFTIMLETTRRECECKPKAQPNVCCTVYLYSYIRIYVIYPWNGKVP